MSMTTLNAQSVRGEPQNSAVKSAGICRLLWNWKVFGGGYKDKATYIKSAVNVCFTWSWCNEFVNAQAVVLRCEEGED